MRPRFSDPTAGISQAPPPRRLERDMGPKSALVSGYLCIKKTPKQRPPNRRYCLCFASTKGKEKGRAMAAPVVGRPLGRRRKNEVADPPVRNTVENDSRRPSWADFPPIVHGGSREALHCDSFRNWRNRAAPGDHGRPYFCDSFRNWRNRAGPVVGRPLGRRKEK